MEAPIINISDVVSIEVIDNEPVYDLTVEDNHNYYLATSNDPILVSNSGKSVWTRWYLVELIKHNVDLDLKIAMFTPENRPVAREYAKIAEALTGQTLEKGHKNSMSDEVMQKALRWVQKHIFVIAPDKYNYENFDGKTTPDRVNTIGAIQNYLVYLKKTENIFGYVIDAWNKIEHEQPKNQTETQFISQQLDRLIDFNEYWDIAGIVIVHPKKIEMTSDGNYKMPSLYDIKGSSAWKEKADIGIIIHRYKMRKLSHDEIKQRGGNPDKIDDDEKWEVNSKAPTVIRTEKIRFEETGNENRIKMKMVGCGRFIVVPPALDELPNRSKTKALPSPPPDEYIQSTVFNENDESDEDLPF